MTRSLLLAITLATSACASHPQRTSLTVRYSCGDTTVTRTGTSLTIGIENAAVIPTAPAQLGWSDDTADHFVTWPHAATDVEAVEYVVPYDRRKDAIVKHYDASAGYASSDWRLLDKKVCRAQGGYTDALARWMNGDSLDKVAKDLSLEDRSHARSLVHKALSQLQKQYFADR